MPRAAAPKPEQIMICIESHLSTQPGVGDYIVHRLDRLPATDFAVKRNPQFFQPDGERLGIFEPPPVDARMHPNEPPPVPPRRFRVTAPYFAKSGDAVLSLQRDEEITEWNPVYSMMTDQLRRELLEEIKD